MANNYLSDTYYGAMDRNYEIVDPTREIPVERYDIQDVDFEGVSMGTDFGVKVSDLGVSTPPFKDQLEALKARIFQGASKVELGFMGQGKGSASQGQYTPESYGWEERRDIREMARLNKIQLSSHAAVHGNSLAGFGQGQFDERQREGTLHEIQKAIDFAADTQTGGAVVFHLSEFPRPVSEWYGEQGFKAFPLEDQKAPFLLVDTRTGRTIDQVKKDVRIVTPEWETDQHGNYRYDESGNKIPKWVPDKPKTIIEDGKEKTVIEPGHFDVREREWDYFVKEAEKWNKAHPNEKRTPAQQHFFERLDMQVAQSRAFAKLREGQYDDNFEAKARLEKALEFYSRAEKNLGPDEAWKLQQQARDLASNLTGNLLPSGSKMPTEIIKDALKQINSSIENERAFVGYSAQAEEQAITKKYAVPVEQYAVDKTADSLARAGIHAMKRTEYMKRQQFNKGVKIDPLFIAVENAHYPDVWGAHPQELKEAILKGRQKMEQQLVYQGYNKQDAHKMAEDHIKATVDIGHANTWRKFFQGDPNKTIEQNDQAFKRWLLNQTEELVKAKIVGHVHITDNFGYDDEHLVPGTGNAPIKEFIEKVKKLSPTLIVEPAHQDFRAVTGSWKRYGQGIFGLPRRDQDSWGDVEHSYFGKPAPPYFLFGESAPSEEWQLWSQTRLE